MTPEDPERVNQYALRISAVGADDERARLSKMISPIVGEEPELVAQLLKTNELMLRQLALDDARQFHSLFRSFGAEVELLAANADGTWRTVADIPSQAPARRNSYGPAQKMRGEAIETGRHNIIAQDEQDPFASVQGSLVHSEGEYDPYASVVAFRADLWGSDFRSQTGLTIAPSVTPSMPPRVPSPRDAAVTAPPPMMPVEPPPPPPRPVVENTSPEISTLAEFPNLARSGLFGAPPPPTAPEKSEESRPSTAPMGFPLPPPKRTYVPPPPPKPIVHDATSEQPETKGYSALGSQDGRLHSRDLPSMGNESPSPRSSLDEIGSSIERMLNASREDRAGAPEKSSLTRGSNLQRAGWQNSQESAIRQGAEPGVLKNYPPSRETLPPLPNVERPFASMAESAANEPQSPFAPTPSRSFETAFAPTPSRSFETPAAQQQTPASLLTTGNFQRITFSGLPTPAVSGLPTPATRPGVSGLLTPSVNGVSGLPTPSSNTDVSGLPALPKSDKPNISVELSRPSIESLPSRLEKMAERTTGENQRISESFAAARRTPTSPNLRPESTTGPRNSLSSPYLSLSATPVPINLMTGPNAPQATTARKQVNHYSTSMVALASLLFPGLGQALNGQEARGLVLAFTWPLVIPWIYAVVQATLEAKRIRSANTRPLRNMNVYIRQVAVNLVVLALVVAGVLSGIGH